MNDSFIDNGEIVRTLQDIDKQVSEELEKEEVDRDKIYRLRFQQLMKGIFLTQNPYTF